ncbi:hypothetical protein GALL_188140 [mine drainage metagenome]|uniref:Uncharacterized protein n=1 Tax=mine drainage metagenome TaxID=410659 RepID=A0A1J5RSY4_9ZZZZ
MVPFEVLIMLFVAYYVVTRGMRADMTLFLKIFN